MKLKLAKNAKTAVAGFCQIGEINWHLEVSISSPQEPEDKARIQLIPLPHLLAVISCGRGLQLPHLPQNPILGLDALIGEPVSEQEYRLYLRPAVITSSKNNLLHTFISTGGTSS